MKPKNSNPAPLETDPALDPAELETASDETPRTASAPELTPATEALTEWDTPPASTGETAKLPPDDEATVAEQLTEEGLEQADRDQRLASADPDFEP